MTSRMLVGLIGANIGESLSPALHEDAFAAAGMVGHYHLMDVDTLPGRRLNDLLAAARTAGFAGVNVTFPFKEAVIPLLDEVSPEAAEIGAVNTVVIDETARTTGHNTDRSGFRGAFLEALGADCVRDKPVLQLGAGGAGRAVAFALMDHRRRPDQDLRSRCSACQQTLRRPRRALRRQALRARKRARNSRRFGRRHRQRHADRHAGPSRPADGGRARSSRISSWPTSSTRRSRPNSCRPRGQGRRTMGGAGMCVHQAAEAFRHVHRPGRPTWRA